MTTTDTCRQIERLQDAINRTRTREGGPAEATRENLDRAAKIRDLACRAVTGQSWAEFEKTVGGEYAPSVSIGRHGDRTAREFADDFELRFGRRPHLY